VSLLLADVKPLCGWCGAKLFAAARFLRFRGCIWHARTERLDGITTSYDAGETRAFLRCVGTVLGACGEVSTGRASTQQAGLSI